MRITLHDMIAVIAGVILANGVYDNDAHWIVVGLTLAVVGLILLVRKRNAN